MLLFALLSPFAAAVETCDDRLDDDHDGLVDCADADCLAAAACCVGGTGDLDADGFCDARDLCPFAADPTQGDGDGDGAGDACDVCASWGDGLAAFGPPLSLATGWWESVALGDLDGDGRLDVVAADLDGNRVQGFANLGGGFFAPGTDVIAGFDGPSAITLADLDGDGDVDVVAGALDANEVRWAENLGAGSFGASVLLFTTSDVWDVDVGDLDGDGDLDVVSASWGDQLNWFENLGGGTFGAARSINGAVWTWASDIEIGDADADGDLDVVGAATTGGDLSWWENTGNGTFSASSHGIDQHDVAYDLELADVDGDGDSDVVAGLNWEFDYLIHTGRFVWYEQVAGTFLPAVVIGDDLDNGLTFEMVDFDGDGDLDLVGAETADSGVSWYANDGSGSFAAGLALADGMWLGLAVADLDGLEGPDLARGSTDGLTVWYDHRTCSSLDTDGDLRSDAQELRVDASDPSVPDAPSDVDGDGVPNDLDDCGLAADPLQADTDLDGFGDACDPCLGLGPDTDFDAVCDDSDVCRFVPDPAQSDRDADGTGDACDVCPDTVGDGIALFPVGTGNSFGSGDSLAAGDLDGDGDDDLVASWTDAFQDEGYDVYRGITEWHRSDGVGGFTNEGEIGLDAEYALPLALGDRDGDGDLDLLQGGDAEISWADNAPGGGFPAYDVFANLGFDPEAVRVLDMDGDGDLEAVTIGQTWIQGKVQWFAQAGGVWSPAGSRDAADLVDALAVGDLDGDGDLDLITAGEDLVAWHANLGGLAYGPAQTIDAVGRSFGIDAGDLDGDGDLEVVAADYGSSLVLAWENLGGGAFGPAVTVGYDAFAVTDVITRDLDGDGDLDLAYSSTSWSGLVVLVNHGNLDFEEQVVEPSTGGNAVVAFDPDADGDLDLASDGTWYPHPGECFGMDLDADGLADAEEWLVYGTDPAVADTDGDGLSDSVEAENGLDPMLWGLDADADGIENALDLCPLVADPLQADADGDGLGDACDPTPLPPVDTGLPEDTDVPPEPADTDPPDTDAVDTDLSEPPTGDLSTADGGCACDSRGGATSGVPLLGALLLARRGRRPRASST